MNALGALVICAFTAWAWVCPECGVDVSGNICGDCIIPVAPPGMVYIPGTDVVVQGDTVAVGPFFIDISPVVYRSVLSWLGENCRDPRVLASVITGQYSESGHFLAFTPLVATATGEYTVSAASLDRPAAGFTWNGASWYLSSRGARLPTLAEIAAALEHGVIEPFNAYSEMQLYARLMETSLGEVLGAISRQAMFAGFSTAEERVMWELTHTSFSEDPVEAMPYWENPYITIFKPLPIPVVTGTGREMGYFNVIFRGALDLPGKQ